MTVLPIVFFVLILVESPWCPPPWYRFAPQNMGLPLIVKVHLPHIQRGGCVAMVFLGNIDTVCQEHQFAAIGNTR